MKLLEIKDLSISFGHQEVVHQANFDLNPGEVLGIVGESGSGKTVTALSILGLVPARLSPDSSIKFMGQELVNAPQTTLQKIRGKEISFIFQEPMSSLNPLHTIGKQIAEAISIHQKLPHKRLKAEALKLLKMTGITNASKRMKAFPYELSGGQRQRVMIAMAIANSPKILIADEPTTALDVTIQAQIIDLLLELKQKLKMSIIFISHDLQIIKKIADKVLVMQNGQIVEQGPVKNIFEKPQNSYTKTLINSFMLQKQNKKVSEHVLLQTDQITVNYPLKKSIWGSVTENLCAADHISLKLHKGCSLGIVGESGSGKTTLGMAIAGLAKHDGKIFIDNQLVNNFNKSFRKKVQVVFQDPYNSLNPRMTVEKIIGEGIDVHFPDMPQHSKIQEITKVLQEVGLSSSDLSKYPHEFSGGQRQRIAIARSLILQPDLLILDEPTSALDVTIQAQIIKLLQDIQLQKNLSYIFISHDMKAIRAISDNILVMKDGKIIEQGSAEQIFTNPQSAYTQKLIAASF